MRKLVLVAPAGGAYSMYTNWEQDGSKQWETFLSSELPDWLAANKGLAPGGHGVVGVSQGGYAAAALVTFHPDRFRYAGSFSGFLTPERAGVDGTITAALRQGGADSDHMWGLPQLGRWKWHSPNQNIQQLVDGGGRRFTINQTGYLLVELDEHFVPQQFDQVFYQIQVAGFTPILTHPERNPVCARRPELRRSASRSC